MISVSFFFFYKQLNLFFAISQFLQGLSAELNTPQDFLKEHLQFLCDTFYLYQGSFETVRQVCSMYFLISLCIYAGYCTLR